MSSSTAKDANLLVTELQDSVDSQVRLLKVPSAREDVRRHAAETLLDAVVSFLQSWDKLEKKQQHNFPNGIVKSAFHTSLAETGPGDGQVRATVLETLGSVTFSSSRQALLDVMPWIMPVDTQELQEATQQVLNTLRDVLLEDADALLPVLGCLALLPLSPQGRTEAWNVALASLPVVSESDLPVLARTLLSNVTNPQDAVRALEALRTEFDLVQATNDDDDDNAEDPIPLIAHVLLGAFQDHENGSLIAKAYLDILQDISTLEKSDDSPEKDDEGATSFLVLDAVAVLALYQNREVKSDIETVMDKWIKEKSFPFATFHLLLKTICERHRPGKQASVLYNRLVPSMLSLGMFLLLAPVRVGAIGEQQDATHEFLVALHHSLDRDYQEEMVQCLLHLSEETSWDRQEMQLVTSGDKRRVRSRKELGKASKREGLRMTADAVHSLLKQLALSARKSVARFKHILVERLTSVTNDSALDNLQSTKDLCAILACLVEPTIAEPGSGIGIDATEVIILLQKLLFTASYSADRRIRGESTLDVGRVIRGLILSTELVKSEALSRSDKKCIHQWVHRILLPSTRRTVDPEIGSHGLQFLSAWSAWRQGDPADTTAAGSAENEKMYDMFQSFKMILANTGLIQMLSLYLERRKRPNETVLGYTSIPSPFLAYSNPSGKRNKRNMIFCVHSYVRTSNVQHPSRWAQMTTWVYNLVDMYLTMGREGTNAGTAKEKGKGRTKWLPDGWLEASLELPSLNLMVEKTGRKTKKAVELLSQQLCRHEISLDSKVLSKSVCSEVANGLCEDNGTEQMKGQVESILRVTLSFMLGIGLSAAVLRNTYAHLLSLDDVDGDVQSRPHEEDKRRRHEIVKLMQYQVMKLYDLRRKSETSIRFLEAIGATIRRKFLRGKQGTSGSIADENSAADVDATFRTASTIMSTAEAACEQTRRVLIQIFCSSDFVDAEILLRCLVDSNDEVALIDGLKASSAAATPRHFKMILGMRTSLLDHLSALLPRSAIHSIPIDDSDATSILSLIKTALTVSVLLPAFRKHLGSRKAEQEHDESLVSDDEVDEITVSDVSGLSSSYFRVAKQILIKATGYGDERGPDIHGKTSSPSKESPGGDGIALSAPTSLMDMLAQSFVESNATDSCHNTAPVGPSVSLVFKSFLHHLRICEDEATALELMDILSILSSKDSELTQRATEACWRVLHTVYTVSSRDVIESTGDDLPLTLQGALYTRNNHQLIDRVLSATIVKMATSDTKNAHDNGMLRHNVLLLWSLTARSPYLSGFDYWSKLTSELARFLAGIDESQSSTLTTDGDTSSQQETERRQRLERRARKRSRPHVSSIPSLTLGSFGCFFELLLHASIAAFAVSPHALTDVAEERASPFQNHHDMVQLVSRLLDIYVEYFHMFPRRIVSVVVAACKHMLSVCLFQVDCCVEWRNAQPVLSIEEKRAGVHDYGAITFLEHLLQSFATWGAGKVMTACQTIRQLTCPSTESDGDDEDATLLASLPQNDKRFTSLMLSAQKTMDALRAVASAHNLVAPQFDSGFTEKPRKAQATIKAVAVDDADKGYHELDLNDEVHEKRDEGASEKKKRRRVAPTLISTEAAGQTAGNSAQTATASQKTRKRRHPVIEEDEHDWGDDSDNDSQKSSDAFGVSGQWGDDKEDAEEDSSSGSLELEVSNIFKAA